MGKELPFCSEAKPCYIFPTGEGTHEETAFGSFTPAQRVLGPLTQVCCSVLFLGEGAPGRNQVTQVTFIEIEAPLFSLMSMAVGCLFGVPLPDNLLSFIPVLSSGNRPKSKQTIVQRTPPEVFSMGGEMSAFWCVV